jgi:3-deoxy-manno-octulosonate cytidylyltransferase (CMP-KDO synthetase)
MHKKRLFLGPKYALLFSLSILFYFLLSTLQVYFKIQYRFCCFLLSFCFFCMGVFNFLFCMFKLLIVIPARYASTRFPGKPLIPIGNRSMLQRVWEQASKVKQFHNATEVVVATDDESVFAHVVSFGGKAVMTAESHQSGTERCFEASQGLDFDVLVNVQGDEPFIQPEVIWQVASLAANEVYPIATLCAKIHDNQELNNPNCVKVVKSKNNAALYFSRSPIPYVRDANTDLPFYRHIGLYAFKKDRLNELASLKESALERIEKLEQLRWLENGFAIGVGECTQRGPAVDTPDDLLIVEKFLKDYPEFQ